MTAQHAALDPWGGAFPQTDQTPRVELEPTVAMPVIVDDHPTKMGTYDLSEFKTMLKETPKAEDSNPSKPLSPERIFWWAVGGCAALFVSLIWAALNRGSLIYQLLTFVIGSFILILTTALLVQVGLAAYLWVNAFLANLLPKSAKERLSRGNLPSK